MRWDRFFYRRTIPNYLLLPFALIFTAVTQLRRKLYNVGLCSVYVPSVPAISIGNIVSGGSGKTPFTIYLTRLLQKRGYRIAVSHRGYKGSYEASNKLISDRDGLLAGADKAGDEPLLLAEKLPGIPVIVGKKREHSLEILQEKFPDLDFIILDDSFQHLRVKKACNLVLFNSITKIGNSFVLPAGILREPLSSLKYADLIIYNGEDYIPPDLVENNRQVFRIHYEIERFYLANGEEIDPVLIRGKKTALISGIGQPESFENTVRLAGIEFSKHYCMPDHYAYGDRRMIDRLSKEIGETYEYLITTEKDFTKLKQYSDRFPFVIVSIRITSEEEKLLLDRIEELCYRKS